MRKSTIALVACLGATLGGASALSFAGDNKDAANMAPPTSESFVKKAGEANLAEVETGKLAQTKAQSPEVKKFAAQMVKDHSKAGAELQTLAQQKNLMVPKDVSAEHKAAMEKLKSKSGPEFDAAFMDQMKKDHDKAVALFTAASTSASVDKDLQGFAKKTLPTLQEHHHMAMDLDQKVATAGSTSTTR
jgi:putative membrane protein